MSKDILKQDDGGIVLSARQVKVYTERSTWSTRIGWFLRNNKKVYISTYSLPDVEYIKNMFGDLSLENVTIIAHEKFVQQASKIKLAYPKIRIFFEKDTHQKCALCEPDTVIIGSANFGHSGWKELSIGLKSKGAYDTLLSEYQERLTEAKEGLIMKHDEKHYRELAEEFASFEEQEISSLMHEGKFIPTEEGWFGVPADEDEEFWMRYYNVWNPDWQRFY